MSIQDLITRYERINNFSDKIILSKVIEDLNELMESRKPEVKQFVADWYEEHKNNLGYYIFEYMYLFDTRDESDFKHWFNDSNTDPFQTLVNMHQFGYEVEKEAKYTVKIKGNLGQYLGRYYLNNEELTPQFIRTQQNDPSYFTKAELEQTGFGWVFSCEGIEVKEVE